MNLNNKKPDHRPKKEGQGPSPAEVPNLGLTMGLSIVGSFYVGRRLDLWLGTSPWLLILFILLGVAAAFKSLFDFAKK
jgi:ATP synthase protein I